MNNAAKMKYPFFVSEDIDGFFGLFVDNIANLMIIVTTMIGLFKIPAEFVFSHVLPGIALSLLVGNCYYSWMAKKLAEKEQRTDVTAIPYGITTSTVFGFLFLIMFPVYALSGGDGILAWKVACAAAFINGFFEIIGAFFGEMIRRITPRAALLGTLAGMAIAFIAMTPTLEIFTRPQISFIPLLITLLTFFSRLKLPWHIPAGLIGVIVGTSIAWFLGFMNPEALTASYKMLGFNLPILSVDAVIEGFKNMGPYIAVIVPLSLQNTFSTMQNVESAAAAGDNYSTRNTMLMDGIGTMFGSLFGGCFPAHVYIGHPGYKEIGCRSGYTLVDGFAVAMVCLCGMMATLSALIPREAILPILLYVGLVMAAQAFQTTPKAHAPAIAIALLPHVANFTKGQIDSTMKALGSNIDKLGVGALGKVGVHYQGLANLASGALLSAMLLATIITFLIDKQFKKAAYTSLVAAALSYFGIIHSTKLALGASPQFTLGYILLAAGFFAVSFHRFDVPGKDTQASH